MSAWHIASPWTRQKPRYVFRSFSKVQCHPNPTRSSRWWVKRWTSNLVRLPACLNNCVVVGASLKVQWVKNLGSKVPYGWLESLGCQWSHFAIGIGWVLCYSSSGISCVNSGISTNGGWQPWQSLRFTRGCWGEQRQTSSWSGRLDCWVSGRHDLLPCWHLVTGGYDELLELIL